MPLSLPKEYQPFNGIVLLHTVYSAFQQVLLLQGMVTSSIVCSALRNKSYAVVQLIHLGCVSWCFSEAFVRDPPRWDIMKGFCFSIWMLLLKTSCCFCTGYSEISWGTSHTVHPNAFILILLEYTLLYEKLRYGWTSWHFINSMKKIRNWILVLTLNRPFKYVQKVPVSIEMEPGVQRNILKWWEKYKAFEQQIQCLNWTTMKDGKPNIKLVHILICF